MTKKQENGFSTLWKLIGGAVVLWLALVIFLAYWFSDKLLVPGAKLANIAKFGDTFGALNALFSGLALAGVIYAMLLQRRELEYQRAELRRATTAQQEQAALLNIQQVQLRSQNEPVLIVSGRTVSPGSAPPDNLLVDIRNDTGPEITRLQVKSGKFKDDWPRLRAGERWIIETDVSLPEASESDVEREPVRQRVSITVKYYRRDASSGWQKFMLGMKYHVKEYGDASTGVRISHTEAEIVGSSLENELDAAYEALEDAKKEWKSIKAEAPEDLKSRDVEADEDSS